MRVRHLLSVTAAALALAAPAVAMPTGNAMMVDGGGDGGGDWSTMPCNDYYFGFIALLDGVVKICLYGDWYAL